MGGGKPLFQVWREGVSTLLGSLCISLNLNSAEFLVVVVVCMHDRGQSRFKAYPFESDKSCLSHLQKIQLGHQFSFFKNLEMELKY